MQPQPAANPDPPAVVLTPVEAEIVRAARRCVAGDLALGNAVALVRALLTGARAARKDRGG